MGSHLNETSLKRQQPENSNSNDDVQPPRKKAAVLETRKYPPSAISPHEELNIDESRLSCAEDSRTDHSQVASNEDQLVCFGMVRYSQLSDLVLHFHFFFFTLAL